MLPAFKTLVIPHSAQRYDTVGDWYYTRPDSISLRVSEMENEDYEFLVLVHELVEAYLCRKHGVSEEAVTDFDLSFERDRADGIPTATGEPGASLNAPYHKEHMLAQHFELILASMLDVPWEEYSKAVDALDYPKEAKPLGDSGSSE